MNVKKLKELLAMAPDDAVLVVPASDHTYRRVVPVVTSALSKGAWLDEDAGEKDTPEGKVYGKRIPVLLFQ